MAGLIAIAFAGTASAQTTIHIAGATTYRAAVNAAILGSSGSGGGILVTGSTTYAYDNSSTSGVWGASAVIIHGYLSNGGSEVYIKEYWTGSAAGVFDVANSNAFTGWIDTPASVSGTIPGCAAILVSTGTNIHGLSYTKTDNSAPDAAMSDVKASTIAYEIAGSTGSGSAYGTIITNAITNLTLVDAGNSTRNPSSSAKSKGTVGVAPMLWVLGNNTTGTTSATAPFSNITQQNVNELVGYGAVPLQAFTGLTTDSNNWVCLIGRNEDSGTRITAFAEGQAGYGPATVKQYIPAYTVSPSPKTQGASGGNPQIDEGGVGAVISSLGLWPGDWAVNTEPSVYWASTNGHSGFNGGGDVAACLSATNTVTSGSFAKSSAYNATIDALAGDSEAASNATGQPSGWVQGTSKVYLVGYLGVADAVGGGSLTAPAGAVGGVVLSYNGVTYSETAVENGQYTYWTFEHLYKGNISGVTANTVDDIADNLYTTAAQTNTSGVTAANQANNVGILYTNMHVSRDGEGKPVHH